MRSANLLLAVALFACCAATAQAASIHGYVFLMPIDAQYNSVGFAEYLNDLNQRASAGLSGEHSVSRPGTTNVIAVSGDGVYDHTVSGPAEYSVCYDTSLHVIANPAGLEGSWNGDTKCAPPPPPPPPPVDGDQCTYDCSPIVINVSGANYELTGAESPVLFDIAATGTPRLSGWTAASTDQAFLWLDRNNNGKVDNGAELFGNATRVRDGRTASNGFEALRDFDSNGDNVIDAHDDGWGRLMLWRDINHNGVSEPAEISPIFNSPIRAIHLTYHWTGRRDRFGNVFKYEALALLNNLSDTTTIAKPIYDIFFVAVH